mgnify:CR=1 FL=1
MALPKKKSRPITVDERSFRYSISTSSIENESLFRLHLTIQLASEEGRLLKVVGLVTRDAWLDLSEPEKKVQITR